MNKRNIFIISSVSIIILVGGIMLAGAMSPKLIPIEVIQYQLKGGKGVLNIAVKDIIMGVGMLYGEREINKEDAITLEGTLSFTMPFSDDDVSLQIDKIRFIEKTSGGEGRVFEPAKIYDRSMKRGGEPTIEFTKEKGQLPFVWRKGLDEYIYMDYLNVPNDIAQGDIVITYKGKFPEKKHPAYYEDRFFVKRASYLRDRNK